MGLSSRLILPLAVLATLAIYLPHLRDGFVYQDEHYAFTVAPVVVHSLSLWLHLLNGLLLWLIGRKLEFNRPELVASIFLIHPLNVEAVAYGAAQSELIILASAFLFILCALYRIWGGLLLPLLALFTTKAAALPGLLTNTALAQGVSFPTWWRWEATAAWRHLGQWLVPVGFSIDHDVIHVSHLVQTLALMGLIGTFGLMGLTWRRWPTPVLLSVGWIALVMAPRFALRVPLSILTEHHWYPVTAGLAVLTVMVLPK